MTTEENSVVGTPATDKLKDVLRWTTNRGTSGISAILVTPTTADHLYKEGAVFEKPGGGGYIVQLEISRITSRHNIYVYTTSDHNFGEGIIAF